MEQGLLAVLIALILMWIAYRAGRASIEYDIKKITVIVANRCATQTLAELEAAGIVYTKLLPTGEIGIYSGNKKYEDGKVSDLDDPK